MNHIEFVQAGLHNRHITFVLKDKVLSGVVIDDRQHTEGKSKDTHYTFIPTENMVKWKEAEKQGDREAMNALSSVVDIEDITWGAPYSETAGGERLVKETELQHYLFDILRKKTGLFRNAVLEPALQNSIRPDIMVEEKRGNRWLKLLIEVKSFSTFTKRRLQDVIGQLKYYEKYMGDAKLILAFPGILPDSDNKLLQEMGIEVWDLRFISSTFPAEIASTGHPILQPLFSAQYSSAGNAWITELKSIKTGKRDENEWSKYQRFIQRTIEYLFGSELSSPITEHSDHFGINRRDFILRNYSEKGFWASLRARYFADYIVIDAKNYSKKVTKKEVLQISNYLKIHGPGLFGIIFSRNGGDNSCYYTCREIWAMEKKLIIVLNDEDLEKMILSKETSDTPEEIIQQKIEQFRLSM